MLLINLYQAVFHLKTMVSLLVTKETLLAWYKLIRCLSNLHIPNHHNSSNQLDLLGNLPLSL